MSLLVQIAIDGPRARSVLVAQPGDELNALLNWCTDQRIRYVKSYDGATTQGLYCAPFKESFVVFQAIPTPDWPDKDPPVFTQDIYYLTWIELLSKLPKKEDKPIGDDDEQLADVGVRFR